MKYVFLDIDGVLNSNQFRFAKFLIYGSPVNQLLHEKIDPEAVKRLNKITDVTGAKIVLSSTWRMGFRNNLDSLIDFFKNVNITGQVVGMTPILNHFRGGEISHWLMENDPKAESFFVILDDSSDMGNLYHRLVRTNLENGLQDQHVARAIEMLGSI